MMLPTLNIFLSLKLFEKKESFSVGKQVFFELLTQKSICHFDFNFAHEWLHYSLDIRLIAKNFNDDENKKSFELGM